MASISFEDSVRYVKGVGPKKAALLASLGIVTVGDLINHFPFRIDDFSKVTSMDAVRPGDEITVQGKVMSVSFVGSQRGRALRVGITDGTSAMYLVWYNMPYIHLNFKRGKTVLASGKVEWRRNGLEMAHPLWRHQTEPAAWGPVVPVYHGTQGMPSSAIERIIGEILRTGLGYVETWVPPGILRRLGYPDERQAYLQIHKPATAAQWLLAQRAHAFREVFLIQTALFSMRKEQDRAPGPAKFGKFGAAQKFLDGLPFALTGAQAKAVEDLRRDLSRGKVMNRLLQGDVGSGKTVVALYALLAAAENGYQGALLAPTEVLAEQHRDTFERLCGDMAAHGLLVGNLGAKKRQEILEGLSAGNINVLIGTHAMLEPGVRWHNLGLLVTDEQHRFGVKQRLSLPEKSPGFSPHVLVMSATPIPRSLALTLYGDLDITIIDAMPPGRIPSETRVLSGRNRFKAYRKVMEEVEAGRQAYVVCPTIKEGKTGRKAAELVKQELAAGYLKGARLGLLHGAMPKNESGPVMRSFVAGDIDVLVSTTVIEIGVDVQNATCMVVEDAGSFGLASLHQLRGRVGRGTAQSFCFLISSQEGPEARRRLAIMEKVSDGFQIAEMDLEQRGPGQFFGTKQSGDGWAKLSDLSLSVKVLLEARDAAKGLVDRVWDGKGTPAENALVGKIRQKFGDLHKYGMSR